MLNINLSKTSMMTTELPELLKSLALELQISIVALSTLRRLEEKEDVNMTPNPKMIPNWEIYESSVDKVILIKGGNTFRDIHSILQILSIYEY